MLERLALIFCLLLIGYALKRGGKDYSNALISMVVFVAFPAVIMERISQTPFDSSCLLISAIAIFSVILGGAIGYAVARMMKLSIKSVGTFVLVCALGNTSFIGFPLLEALYGSSDNIAYAIYFDQFGTFFSLMTFGTFVSVVASGQQLKISNITKEIVLFPPFVALAVALALKSVGYPPFLLTLAGKLALTLVPLATIAIGMKISFSSIAQNIKPTGAVLLVKCIIVPAVVMLVVYNIFDINSAQMQVAVLEAAMPPMVMTVVFAQRYGLNTELAVNSVVLGIFASYAIIPTWFYFLT